MAYGNISAQISDESVNQVINLVREIDKLLPFVINLSTEEMKTIVKMGDKSLPFVEKSLELANQHLDFVPTFLELEEFKKDLELAKQLKKIMNVLMPLVEKIRDTHYASGSEAFFQARLFYSSAKDAAKANVPGSDVIVKELGKRYKRIRKANDQNEEENP